MGISGADKDAYLMANDYNSLSGTYKEKIGIQAWHSMYNRGFEARTFSRRLDFPMLETHNSASDPLPTRLIYPVKEYSVNETNMKAAVQKLPSKTDSQGDKVFGIKIRTRIIK